MSLRAGRSSATEGQRTTVPLPPGGPHIGHVLALEAGHHPEKVSGTLNGYALMTGLRRLSG